MTITLQSLLRGCGTVIARNDLWVSPCPVSSAGCHTGRKGGTLDTPVGGTALSQVCLTKEAAAGPRQGSSAALRAAPFLMKTRSFACGLNFCFFTTITTKMRYSTSVMEGGDREKAKLSISLATDFPEKTPL